MHKQITCQAAAFDAEAIKTTQLLFKATRSRSGGGASQTASESKSPSGVTGEMFVEGAALFRRGSAFPRPTINDAAVYHPALPSGLDRS